MSNKFSVVDYMRARMPERPARRKDVGLGWLEGGKAFIEGAPIVFDSLINTAGDVMFGFDPNDKERETDRAEDAARAEAYRRKYQGRGVIAEAVAGAAESSGASLAGLPAAALAGIAASPSGPLAVGAAGAAGGAVASRADYVANQRRLYADAVAANGGKPLTEAQWASVQAEFGPELAEHAVIEGAGEGVGEAMTFGLFKPLGALGGQMVKNVGEGVTKKVMRGAGKVGADVAGELATETGQSYMQGDSEAAMFGTPRMSLGETFKEVAGPTIVQSLLFAGGAKASNVAANKLRGRYGRGLALSEVTPANSPDNPFGEALTSDGYQHTQAVIDQPSNPAPENSPEVDLLGLLNKRLEAKNDAADRTMAAVHAKLAPTLDTEGNVVKKGGGIDSLEDGSLVVYGARDGQGAGVDEAPLVLTSDEDKRIALDVAQQLREDNSARSAAQVRREAPAWIAKKGKPVSAEAFLARNNGYQVPAGEFEPVNVADMSVPPSAPMMSGGGLGLRLGERAERMAAWEAPQAVPQIASMAQPMPATGDNVTPVAPTAPVAPVQEVPTNPQAGFGLDVATPKNVTNQPVEAPKNVTEAPGTIRGVPLSERIVIGGVKPWGATDEDVRAAEQQFQKAQAEKTATVAEPVEASVTPAVEEQSVEPAGFGTVDEPAVSSIADHFKAQLTSGKSYRTIGEARQEVASKMGLKQKDLVHMAKTVDEAIELGVVRAARTIVRSGKSPVEIYRDLVDLYKRQPNLGVRTSTSIAEQAYSTPVPLAYLADVLAGVTESTRVYEPTAGNGALLLTASPENAVVNELNHDRAERLRSQGFTVTEEDASTRQLDSDVDAVVANPPFGSVMQDDGSKRKFRFRKLETTEIDQAIALNALDELSKDGRAVLIIGGKQGNEKARATKYNTAAQRAFWNTMFENFNVVDHFTVSGDLYSRQGAKYPIDFVVIDGHTPTENPVFPAARVPRVYESFEALEEKFDEVFAERASERPEFGDSRQEEDGAKRTGGLEPRGRSADERLVSGDEGRGKPGRDRTATSGRVDRQSEQRRDVDAEGVQPSGSPVQPEGERGAKSPVRRRSLPDESADAERSGIGRGGLGRDADVVVDNLGADAVRAGLDVEQSAIPETPKAKKAAPKPKATSTQSAYKASSDGFQLGTLVPKNMDAPVQDALRRVKDRYSDVDAFVTRELGYDSVGDMHKAFAAEQVDALALALDNMGKGKGFILGDQTGIGKGRVCAGILRWAKKNGKTPIFVTMLPDLYADMMRDLNDIGVQDFHPFITNSDISGKNALVAPDGSALSAPKPKAYKSAVSYIKENNRLPDEYDAVFTTYKQLQSVKGVPSERQVMLDALRKDAVLVLDEAHNAGGASSSIGLYMRDYTEQMSGGVLYSSATYAKRPDVMSLYNKTDITMIGSQAELEETTRAGGLPMQQVISAMLTGSGQYLRREKSYEGATMNTTEAAVDVTTADAIAKCMESIMAFSFVMESATAVQDEIAKARGRAVTGTRSTGGAGAKSVSFGSLMHNLVAQTTLAIKADAVVDAAAKAVERGEKPVITLSNTMGSFIADYASKNNLKAGDAIDLTFADMFKSYLEKSREVRIKEASGESRVERLTDEQLGTAGVRAYNAALKVIEQSDFSRLPVSPIDYVLDGLNRAGVRASEITGRTAALDYSGEEPAYRVREAGVAEKQAASRGFNGGDIDCLIINRSGSTGISLHASEKFVDQKRRAMLIVQPDLDIDVFMQTLGRVFRTGQVVPPKYEFVLSDMPSERRPAAVLGKKMASLNANTTASAKGTQSFDNIPDFLNAYGDQAALELLQEDGALNARLGYPLKTSDKEDEVAKADGLVAKLTGRIPLLPVSEQADVYDRLLKIYNGVIALADATGTNILDVKARPLDAKVVSRAPLTPKQRGDSPFAASSELCVCDVKVVGKPYSSAEVKKHVEEGKAAVAALYDGLAEKASAYMRKSVARFKDEEAKQRERDKIDDQLGRVSTAIDDYPVGTRVRMTGSTGSYVGVVVNYLSDAGKKDGSNPVAPSAWSVVVDVADAKRRLVVPLSKLVLGDGNIDGGRMLMNYTYDGVSATDFWKRFDDAQSESRETRLIVMGNIPAGYAKLSQAGEIITFDMHDGKRVMGVLLPKEARGEKVMEDMPVRFAKDEEIIEFFDRTNGRVQVVSTDELIAIDGMQGGKWYHIRVPGSKAEGGRFFLNKSLLGLIGKDFVKRNGEMHVEFNGDARLRSVLVQLGMMGVRFQTKVSKDIAREITGTSVTFVKEGDASPAVSSDAYASLRPSFASTSPYAALRLDLDTRKALQKIVGSTTRGAINTGAWKESLANAKSWVRENIKGAIRAKGDHIVVFDESTVNDTFSHLKYPNKFDTIPVIRDILKNGAFLGDLGDLDGHNLVNLYWGGTVLLNGEKKVIFVRARRPFKQATKFYVHDVFTEEDIKKYPPLAAAELEAFDRSGAGSLNADRPNTPSPRGDILERMILRTIMEVNGLSRNEAQDVVDKLGASASGAAPVNVVQSFEELPKKLKQSFKGREGDLEGVYDEGTVWLVADNLASPDRVAEVWMHEQVGHGGFEALMPEKEKTQLLNRLFAMMGGKSNAALRGIAEEYGLDLGKRTDQHRALREYLADLAEKEGLSGQEMSRWQKAWKHIADTLKKLFYRLTGKHAKIAEMEVRDLLTAMKRRVRDGGPDGPKGGTYASFMEKATSQAVDKTLQAMRKPEYFRKDVQEALSNLSEQAKKDIGWWNKFVSQPYALAKKFPLLRTLMDIQSLREDKRREAFVQSMKGVDTFQKMKQDDKVAYQYARDLIIDLDSELGDRLRKNLKAEMFTFDEDGNRTGVNPEYYAEMRDLLMGARNKETHTDEAAFKRAVDAYMGVRRSLDRDLDAILARMEGLGFTSKEQFMAAYKKREEELKADTSISPSDRALELKAMRDKNDAFLKKLDTMRKRMGSRPFYFPHMRFGSYYALMKKDGKTVYRVHFDAATDALAAVEAAKIKATMQEDLLAAGENLDEFEFDNGKIQGIPQEVFADALDAVNTQEIINEAIGRLGKTGKYSHAEVEKMRDALMAQTAEVMKSSGFGQHMMRRSSSRIRGYETEDVYKSLSAYKSGLHGWLTKMEASYQFATALSEGAKEGDAKRSPEMFRYAKQYVRDMLRNVDKIDQTNGRIRAGLFLWFLGGNIKSALVNATQNYTLGVPVLGAEVGAAKAYKLVGKDSLDAVKDWASKREAGEESKVLTKDEAAFLDDFQKHGEALARKTMELTGMKERGWSENWATKLAELVGKPIEYAEKFNRMGLALAAYRAAKTGLVTNEGTLAKYGENKGEAWSEANARKFARDIVNEAHFVYGKANQPSPVRGFARGLAFGYTFRTYAQSLASWYWRMLSGEKGNVGRIAAAQAALHAVTLGGVAALPLYGTMRTVLTELFGGEPPEEKLGYDQIDILMYGLPSLAGMYLGGSMELDLPVFKEPRKNNESWIEQVRNNLWLAVTGPLGGAGDRLARATYYAGTGQVGRTIEELAPTAMSNALKAYRLSTEGARTKSGKPIPAEGDKSGKPAKLSGAEATLQALGFQPVSRAKGWHSYQTKQEKTAYKSEFQSDLVTRYVTTKNPAARAKLERERLEWNKEHPDQPIKPLWKLAKRREAPVK